MEQTASRVAIFPRRNPIARQALPARSGCTIHWFRGDGHRTPSVAAKRVAILDPFKIEQRLLVALAQAHGHSVAVHHDAEDLLASLADRPPQIAFVHMCFGAMMRAAAAERPLPPIVLIDSCSIAGHGAAQLAPIGDFTALRFPIGLKELAEAIRRNAL